MRTTTITLLLLFITSITFSQEGYIECATQDNNDPVPSGVYSYSTDPTSYLEGDPVVLNVKFWKVNDSNGDFYADFSEDKLLEGIAKLNISFNQYNIFFKYRGWEDLNSPADLPDIRRECIPDDPNYPDGDCTWGCKDYAITDPNGYSILDYCQALGEDSLFVFARDNGLRDTSAMNIYVTSWNVGFGNVAGGIGHNQLVVKVGSLNEKGMTHEMGHVLGLGHTRSIHEHVTRDITDPNYNASCVGVTINCKGDYIHDTAANPGFRQCDSNGEYCYPWIMENCTYNPDSPEEDNSIPPEPYAGAIFPEDVINVMGNAYDCMVDDSFTPGQVNWMHETIEYDAEVQATVTTVASLYEPYKGEYPEYYPYPEPWELPLFQPGFAYFFVACDGEYPQPAPYGELFYYDLSNTLFSVNSDETAYNTIIHPNHSAIVLKPVSISENDEVFKQPQKCYNNYSSPPVIGGTIIKFNDNVLNTNVTITEQDSISINDTELIENLQPGLYNIIKNYNNGETQENVILKEDN